MIKVTKFLREAVLFVKSGVYYVYQLVLSLVPFFGRKNWKTIRQYFAMAHTLSKFMKQEKLAKNVGWLSKKFEKLTRDFSDEDTKRAASEISAASGVLDDLKIGYSEGKVTGNVGPLEAKYDPKDGSFKFGLKL